jgi:4-amino-4-deoxy-L-arabinose transferase-like glycosyltransferase
VWATVIDSVTEVTIANSPAEQFPIASIRANGRPGRQSAPTSTPRLVTKSHPLLASGVGSYFVAAIPALLAVGQALLLQRDRRQNGSRSIVAAWAIAGSFAIFSILSVLTVGRYVLLFAAALVAAAVFSQAARDGVGGGRAGST